VKKIHRSDWKLACLAGIILLILAAFAVFVIHPGGFEGQIGWAFGLLPGAMLGAYLGDLIYKSHPALEPIVFWTLIIAGSFLWYFSISYLTIKIGRPVSRALRTP
jgi:hypothetical protein